MSARMAITWNPIVREGARASEKERKADFNLRQKEFSIEKIVNQLQM